MNSRILADGEGANYPYPTTEVVTTLVPTTTPAAAANLGFTIQPWWLYAFGGVLLAAAVLAYLKSR